MTTITTRIDSVAKSIKAAGKACGTMLAECKKAAVAARDNLNRDLPFDERIAAVVALYKEDFAAVDANVKRMFVNALTVLAGDDTPVTIASKDKEGKPVEKHIAAEDAIDLPKHALVEAAKQVREQNGAGRAAGGGRKPRVASHAPATEKVITAGDKLAVGAGNDQLAAWLDNVAAYMADPASAAKVVAAFKEAGYKVTKAK